MKRRNFVASTGMALAGISVINASVFYPLSSKNNIIKIGIIGTGNRGGGLIPIINKINGLQVVACCDLLPFRLKSAIKKVDGKAKSYSDYRKLLDDKNIDAVLIATPFSEH